MAMSPSDRCYVPGYPAQPLSFSGWPRENLVVRWNQPRPPATAGRRICCSLGFPFRERGPEEVKGVAQGLWAGRGRLSLNKPWPRFTAPMCSSCLLVSPLWWRHGDGDSGRRGCGGAPASPQAELGSCGCQQQ